MEPVTALVIAASVYKVPLVGVPTVNDFTFARPSTSVALSLTAIPTVGSSAPVAVVATATGASLTGGTVMLRLAAGAVGGGVGEVRGAIEVRVWFEVNRGFAVDRVNTAGHRFGHGRVGVEGAVGWRADGERFHVRQAVYVGRAQLDCDTNRWIFSTGRGSGHSNRRIVNRGHGDAAVGRWRGQYVGAVSVAAVGGGVGEVRGAVEVRVSFEVNRGFAVDRVNTAGHRFGHRCVGVEGTVGWRADGERLHVRQAVYVGRAQLDCDTNRWIFSTGRGSGHSNRRIVDRGHVDAAVGRWRGQYVAAVSVAAVGSGVGEVRGAVEVRVWFEVNRGFAVDRVNTAGHWFGHGRVGVEGAVGWRADGERFHVRQAVYVGRAQLDRNAYSRIFSTGRGGRRSHRRIVNRGHGDSAVSWSRSQRATAVNDTAVGCGVSEVRRAVEVRVWFEVNRGFAVDCVNGTGHRFGHGR